MMRPQPAFIIGDAAARAMKKGPLTLVSMISRQVSGSVSQKHVGSVRKFSLTYFMPRPALLTRMSSFPKRRSVSPTSAAQFCASVTSAIIGATASRGASAVTRSSSWRSRAAVAITFAPARARPSTIERPSPRPPPVTIATLPSSGASQIGAFVPALSGTVSAFPVSVGLDMHVIPVGSENRRCKIASCLEWRV